MTKFRRRPRWRRRIILVLLVFVVVIIGSEFGSMFLYNAAIGTLRQQASAKNAQLLLIDTEYIDRGTLPPGIMKSGGHSPSMPRYVIV